MEFNFARIAGKKILITGGAGFLGSNLAKKCLELEAEVVVFVRSRKNLENIEEVKDKIEIIEGDLTKEEDIKKAIKDRDYLFHFAWQTELKRSMENPLNDLENDCKGMINILECCRKYNRGIKIIFPSTVTVVGNVDELPVNEDIKENPGGIYEIHKVLAENYLKMYYEVYGLKTCVLRLSNVFGEGQRIDNPNRGVLNFMIGRALQGEILKVYGGGLFIRDYNYVQNYIDAFLLAALSEKTNGQVYMLGSGEGIMFKEVVEKIKNIVKELTGKNVLIENVPFPEKEHKINKRNFIADSTRFRDATGWYPRIEFEEGLRRTIKFYINKKKEVEDKQLNFLITGGLGHVGSALLREYIKREDIKLIRILDNLSTQRYCSLFEIPKTHVKIEFIEGDINEPAVLEKAIKDIDVVIHLAAITNAPETIQKPEETKKINFEGTKSVLESAIKSRIKKFIFPSSTSVYGEAEGIVDENTPINELKPASPYAEWKLKAEKIVQEANGINGIQTFVLRKGTIFGKSIGMRFHTAVNKFLWLACLNKPLNVWDSAINSKRPYLGLKDAIRAYEFIEKHGKPGELYNVLTDNYTINEIVEAIKKFKSNLKIEITKSPILNQKSYEVSNQKIRDLGFEFKDNLSEMIQESLDLFKGIKN